MATGVRIEGMASLQELLHDKLPKEAHNLARAATHQLAKETASKISAKTRKRTGKLAKSFKAVRGRGSKTAVYSDVVADFYWRFVEHGTAPHSVEAGANKSVGRGAGLRLNRTTRALERQTKLQHRMHPGTKAQPFVSPVVEQLRSDLPKRYRELIGVQLEKKLKREARKRQRALAEGL